MIGFLLFHKKDNVAFIYTQKKKYYPLIKETTPTDDYQNLITYCKTHYDIEITKKNIIDLNITHKKIRVYGIVVPFIIEETGIKYSWMPYFYQLEKISQNPFCIEPEKKIEPNITISSSLIHALMIE